MTDRDLILSEFIDAWSSGQSPDPDAYLSRIPSEEREELAAQITTYLSFAPEPEYDASTWAALAADPVAARVADMELLGHEPWPSLLPRLRRRLGIAWGDVAGSLGFSGAERAKATGFLEEMESGSLQPEQVTGTLLARLGRALGVDPERLEWRGSTWTAPAQPAMYRSSAEAPPPQDRLEAIAAAMTTPAEPWDDVDQLFLGGRDG